MRTRGHPADIDRQTTPVMKSERSSLVKGSDLLKCRSAHTSVGDMWRGRGRTHWQGGDSERSSLVRGSDLPKCRSAHTSVGDMWRGPGRTHWQGGDQPGRQAHKLEEMLRVHNTKQDEKNAVFRRNDT